MNTTDQQVIELARQLSTQATVPATITRASPSLVELLGTSLAAILLPFTPDTVVLWSDPLTTVLGHVTARELKANMIYAYSDEGILSLSSPPTARSRIALVDYNWEPYPGLVPLLRMLQSQSTVVAVSSVLSLPPTLAEHILGITATATLADLNT